MSDQMTTVLLVCGVAVVIAGVVALIVRGGAGPARRARPGRKPPRPGPKVPGPGRKGAGPGRRGPLAGRATRPARPAGGMTVRSRPPGGAPGSGPAPGEIWWADVPYTDGTGSKVRPCLVVRTHPRGAEVLKITSQDKSDRDDHLPIPTAGWDRNATKDSWLDVSEPHFVGDGDFRDRAAASCDARVWKRVTRLHDTGWVHAG